MDATINISTATIMWAATAFVGFFGREILKWVFEKFLTARATNGNGDQTKMLAMKELIRETVDQSVTDQLEKSVLPILKTSSEAVAKLVTVSEKINETLIRLAAIEERKPVEVVQVVSRRRKK